MSSKSNDRVFNGERRTLVWLVGAVALETFVTIGHFGYGAYLYDDPSRWHVVGPGLVFLVAVAGLASLYAARPGHVQRWLFTAAVALPYLGMFGAYHGAFQHGLKLILYQVGVTPERLATIFDSPDFAVPNDLLFEVSGISTFFASILVGYFLLRFLRRRGRHSSSGVVAAHDPEGTLASTDAEVG
jgi:hypothetical protein